VTRATARATGAIAIGGGRRTWRRRNWIGGDKRGWLIRQKLGFVAYYRRVGLGWARRGLAGLDGACEYSVGEQGVRDMRGVVDRVEAYILLGGGSKGRM
jgi:hypothetical protein